MDISDIECKPNNIDEYFDLLSEVDGLDVRIVQVRKDYRVIQVDSPDPRQTRKELVRVVGPKLGIDFLAPRKTKKDGYTLEIPTFLDDDMTHEGEPIVVRIRRGGIHRAGRRNEEGFQNFIKDQIESSGVCHLDVTDNYGVNVKLDIVEIVDASASHGKNGEQNRSDTTVKLADGTMYGISHKKTNATYVCKAKKMFSDIIFHCGQRLRNYAKEHGMRRGDYMDVRITNRDLMDLCWFGTDISTGAVFIGDFEDMSSGQQHIERIIRNGDTDVLTSFPIYTKWLIANGAYTIRFCGVSVASKGGRWIVDDVELPGVNAPLPEGKHFKVGQEEPMKRRRRRKVTEDIVAETQLLEEARQNDLWDTVAYCAENHRLVWLKYETVEDGEIISRKVAPYSYRTRDTKVRGRSTYFYAEDYTPGQDHTIKCFLIENCLDAKESRHKFTPRHPVEIRQEIDRLEKKRKEDELKKQRQQKKRKEQPSTPDDERSTDNDEIVKGKPKDTKKPLTKPKSEPRKPIGKPEAKKPDDKEKEQQKKIDGKVKVDVKPDETKPEDNKQKVNKPSTPTTQSDDNNAVTIGDDEDNTENPQMKDGDIQVTDGDGNVVK